VIFGLKIWHLAALASRDCRAYASARIALRKMSALDQKTDALIIAND
jgi:hypothetical protein